MQTGTDRPATLTRYLGLQKWHPQVPLFPWRLLLLFLLVSRSWWRKPQPALGAGRRICGKQRILRCIRDRQFFPGVDICAMIPTPRAVQIHRNRHTDLLRIDEHRPETKCWRQLADRCVGPVAPQANLLTGQQTGSGVHYSVRLKQQGEIDALIRTDLYNPARIDIRMRHWSSACIRREIRKLIRY